MSADSKTRLWLRLLFAIAAIVASAFACVSYVAHGIAYSDVLGAANMNGVAAAEKRSAQLALVLAVMLQLAAVAFAAALFDNTTAPALFTSIPERPSRASVCVRYLAVFVVVMIVTLVLAVAVAQALRYVNFR